MLVENDAIKANEITMASIAKFFFLSRRYEWKKTKKTDYHSRKHKTI